MPDSNRYYTRRQILNRAAAVGGAVFLASCAPSSTTTTAGAGATTTAGSAAAPTVDELVAAAEAEGGALTWYLPGQADTADAIQTAFKAAYPFTNPQVQSLPFGDLPSKLITEAITDSPTADVFMLPAPFREAMMDNNVIAPTPPLPAEADVIQSLLDPDGFSHPVYILLITTLYNTNVLPDGPPSPEEMSSSDWSGRLSFDRVQNNGQSTLWLASWRHQWGDAEWETWLDGLAANDVFITATGGDTYAAVLRGERDFGIGSSNDVNAQEPGTPVAADYSYPPVPFIQNLWLTAGAANPATGTLFINWCLSDEGQETLASTGRTPVLPTVDTPVSVENLLPEGVEPLSATGLFDYYANATDYIAIMAERWPA